MYADWFRLSDRPFSITPDPRYLFLSERHREALAHLLFGVTEGGGFIQLTGEVGTGKTTLTRTLLDQLPANVDAALVYNPRVSLAEFLETICDELGVPLPLDARSPKQLTDALNHHLLATHERGRRTVLIVDEAQNLDVSLLEQIRLLTNLETHREKLLQILLIGQPELRDTLARNDLRQLAQRITARYHLEPLDTQETAAYVRHRLEVGGAGDALFTPRALRAVHRVSGGIPRRINIVCDRALLGAFADGARRVDASLVRRAAHEVAGELEAPRIRWAAAVGAAMFVALLGSAVAWHLTPPIPMITDAPPMLVRVAAPAPDEEREDALTLPPADDLAGASAALLTRWGVEPPAGLPGSLCAAAANAGLACVRGRGTWNNLRVLDRPALLELRADGVTRTVLLTGIDRTTARLRIGGEEREVPLLALDPAWLGEYLLLWRPPIPEAALQRGYVGDSVAWLRRAFEAPGGLVFDAELEAKVREFQQSLGLSVDGVAGEQTLVHLDGISASGGPRLSAHVPDS